MDATLILIIIAMPLWNSSDPTDVARLEAQARLVAAYEEMKWPRRPPSVAGLIRHLMDQHGLTHLGCSGERKIKMRVRGADGKAQIGTLEGQILFWAKRTPISCGHFSGF